VLGTIALLLLALTAFMVFEDTRQRTRSSTYVTIASQMQYHTQRLRRPRARRARQPERLRAAPDSRDEFANYSNVLQNGGFAFNVNVPPAGTTRDWRAACRSSRIAGPILRGRLGHSRGEERPRGLGAEHRADPYGIEEMATLAQELTTLMGQTGTPPGRSSARTASPPTPSVGRGSAEILGSDTIDPEVPSASARTPTTCAS
jgi:hypothetical protein